MPKAAILPKDEICQRYIDGARLKDLVVEYKTSTTRLRRLFESRNIVVRGWGSHLAKYYPDDYNPSDPNYVFTKKKCDTCHQDKDLSEFHLSKNSALGRKSTCKACRHDQKSIDTARRREKYNTDAEYRERTLRLMAVRKKTVKYKKWTHQYYKKRRTEPAFRVRSALHTRLKQVLTESGVRKSLFMKNIIGCSHKELLTHLEGTWAVGMSWSNYGWGDGKWVIDHVIPCAAFDLTDVEQQKKCFHHTNLKAMWWRENARKNCFLSDGRDARKVFGTVGYQSSNTVL